MKKNLLLLIVSTGLAVSGAHAQSSAREWWEGQNASGNWLGARDTLADHGLSFGGHWKGTYYGNVAGGLKRASAFDEELVFFSKVDFHKLAGIPGLGAYASVRWRDGENIDQDVGASPAFNPTAYQVGKQWRFQQAYLSWESGDLAVRKNFVTLSGGWQNPYHFFAQQPESKLFNNNAITQTKGIGANIPFNGAYGAWGGMAKIQPSAWSYLQGGLYAAVPNATDTANHGLYFALADPPSSNGLYFLTEAGVTPKISGLPGKYALGSYYWGLENSSFFGASYDQKFGFYWQADQMLYREPTKELKAFPESDGESAIGKSGKESLPVGEASKEGLYFFSFLSYAPKYDNALPFYFHSGLVYRGLIPGRNEDQLGVAFAYGQYSYYQILSRREAGNAIQQTYESVLEFDYRIQVNRFAYVQPSLQYLIRPGGTGLIENATVLGVHLGVTF